MQTAGLRRTCFYTQVLHLTNGSNLIHFVICNVTNPRDSKDLPPPFLPTALFLTYPVFIKTDLLKFAFAPCGVHHKCSLNKLSLRHYMKFVLIMEEYIFFGVNLLGFKWFYPHFLVTVRNISPFPQRSPIVCQALKFQDYFHFLFSLAILLCLVIINNSLSWTDPLVSVTLNFGRLKGTSSSAVFCQIAARWTVFFWARKGFWSSTLHKAISWLSFHSIGESLFCKQKQGKLITLSWSSIQTNRINMYKLTIEMFDHIFACTIITAGQKKMFVTSLNCVSKKQWLAKEVYFCQVKDETTRTKVRTSCS